MSKLQIILLIIIIANIIIGLFLIKDHGFAFLVVKILFLAAFIWDMSRNKSDSEISK